MRKENKKQNMFRMLVLFAYTAANIFCVAHHETWRDEAQAWLIARDLSPLQIMKQMGWEGHPCLWHFLLVPFAKTGCPVWTCMIVSGLVMFAAAAVLLWFVEVPWWLKLLLLFSPAYFYFYPVVARSYCLAAFFMTGIMALYNRRKKHPLWYCIFLAGLVQTHILLVPAAGMFSVFFLWERMVTWKKEKSVKAVMPLFLPLLSVVLLAAQVFGGKSAGKNQVEALQIGSPVVLFSAMRQSLHEILGNLFVLSDNLADVLLIFLFAATVIIGIKYHKGKEGIIFWGATVGYVFICRFFTIPNYQKSLLWIYFFIVYGCSVSVPKTGQIKRGRPVMVLVMVTVAVTVLTVQGWPAISADVTQNYSDGKNVADYIKKKVPKDEVILVDETSKPPTVAAYLSKNRFFSPVQNRYLDFTVWDANWEKEVTWQQYVNAVKRKYPHKTSFYLLTANGSKVSGTEHVKAGWLLLYQTRRDNISNELFCLYKINI